MDAEAVLNFADHVIMNADSMWLKATLEQKQR